MTLTQLRESERRAAGEPELGLLIAPEVSVSDLGRWGEYVLAPELLRVAIARAASTLGYHSRGDRMELSVAGGVARLSYFNATRGQAGYTPVATGTAGLMLSLFRSYLSPDWRPRLIELDIPRPRAATLRRSPPGDWRPTGPSPERR